jgi:hypothetical protein
VNLSAGATLIARQSDATIPAKMIDVLHAVDAVRDAGQAQQAAEGQRPQMRGCARD